MPKVIEAKRDLTARVYCFLCDDGSIHVARDVDTIAEALAQLNTNDDGLRLFYDQQNCRYSSFRFTGGN